MSPKLLGKCLCSAPAATKALGASMKARRRHHRGRRRGGRRRPRRSGQRHEVLAAAAAIGSCVRPPGVAQELCAERQRLRTQRARSFDLALCVRGPCPLPLRSGLAAKPLLRGEDIFKSPRRSRRRGAHPASRRSRCIGRAHASGRGGSTPSACAIPADTFPRTPPTPATWRSTSTRTPTTAVVEDTLPTTRGGYGDYRLRG